MRRKFSTLLEENLYDRTRQEAIRQGKQIADVVCDALAAYLDSKAAAVMPAMPPPMTSRSTLSASCAMLTLEVSPLQPPDQTTVILLGDGRKRVVDPKAIVHDAEIVEARINEPFELGRNLID